MIYIFLANGFEEIEALAPVDILRRAELDVKMVSITNSTNVKGSHGITVVADATIDEVELNSDVEMLILPGGMPGTLNLDKCEELTKMLKAADDMGLFLGAICAAPSVFGHIGLLDGKSATVFPGFESQMGSAKIIDESVVLDGNIITAKGAGVSIEFGLKLVEVLISKDRADILGASMQCKR